MSKQNRVSRPIRMISLISLALVFLTGQATLFGAEDKTFSPASVTVDFERVINPEVIGGGVNFALSDFLYIGYPERTEWDGIHSRHLPDLENAAEWQNLYELMDFAGFNYIRLEVGMTQWEPVNDDDDPRHLNLKDGFSFSPGFAAKHPDLAVNCGIYNQFMYRLLDYWEKRDAYVILGNWRAGPPNFCPDEDIWLKARDESGKRRDFLHDPEAGMTDMEEYAEAMAAIMVHLKSEKPYQCVKGISVFNEPEGLKDYLDTTSRWYLSLGEQLRRYGIRDQVLIQAFDGALFWTREEQAVPDGVARMLARADGAIDIISAHDYNAAPENMKGVKIPNVHGTLGDYSLKKIVEPALAQIASADTDGQIEPLVIGEFGAHAFSGGGETVPANYAQRMHSVEGLIQYLNHGAKAVAYWVFNNNYHEHWRVLDYAANDPLHRVPNPTNYYPLALACKYIQNGSDVVWSVVEGGADENGNQCVFMLAAEKDGEKTLLLLNSAEKATEITVNGVSDAKPFRKLWVAESRHDRITLDGKVTLDGAASVELRPRSITVLTTYGYGGAAPKGH